MTSFRAPLALVLSLAACLAVPHAASAQPAGRDAQTAITLGRDAKDRFDKGEWAEAYVLFEAAEQKAHSPVLLLYMARCQEKQGRLLAARDLYRRVTTEPLDARSPAPFRAAVEDAKAGLAAVDLAIPRLTVVTQGLSPDVTLELDGRPLARADAERGHEVDPGPHHVVAKRGADTVTSADVVAEPGKAAVVELAPPPPPPAVAPPPSAPPPPAPKPAPPPREGSLVPGILVLGGGVAALAVGAIARVSAFGTVDDVKARCEGTRCLPEDEAEIEGAETLQTVSTICLVGGGVLAAAGVTLLIVRPGGDDGPQVALDVGPGHAVLRGTF